MMPSSFDFVVMSCSVLSSITIVLCTHLNHLKVVLHNAATFLRQYMILCTSCSIPRASSRVEQGAGGAEFLKAPIYTVTCQNVPVNNTFTAKYMQPITEQKTFED